jgi:PPK2 family polyphosphate:nucleotide phosphotransferase
MLTGILNRFSWKGKSPMDFKCPLESYRVAPGSKVDLTKRPTRNKSLSRSKKHYRELLGQYREEISDLQSVLYAHDRYSILLIFQGMDTAGKGGAIKHVMSGVNPQGCQVYTFGPPSHEELDHDYLWRTNKRLPERGRIGIFDRSYYEEVLIIRVRPDLLAKQRLPAELVGEDLWSHRYEDIRNTEKYLYRNGTRIVKFFLHLSPDEQCRRLLARIDDEQKNWKFTLNDLDSRRDWDKYQEAFADCLQNTSTQEAPWYVVPADNKRDARLIISHTIVETLRTLKMSYPTADKDHRQQLSKARKMLQRELK